jgi:hypothetical protein
METINLNKFIKEYHKRACIEAIEKTIEYARHLNEFKKTSVSMPLPGSEFLHGMLKKKLIPNTLYKQLIRLAEDPEMKYEIIIK